jgi:glycosyltransferase involved in cell wall biosynthesis
MRRKIMVLGPLPPPFGGVSLHIVRFLELLKSQGVDAGAQPYTGIAGTHRFAKLFRAARMLVAIYAQPRPGREGVLHLHYGGLGYFLALAPILRTSRARLVVTFHSVRVLQDLERAPSWLRRRVLGLLERFSLFVAVRSEIGDSLRSLGLAGPDICVMPAFLPPAPAELAIDRLPPDVAAVLTAAQDAGDVQVCCAAYYLGRGYGHDDIYGIEALLAALSVVGDRGGRLLHLWVLVSNRPQGAEQLAAEARIRSAARAIPGFNLHLHYGLPLVPVMCRTSAFLRPSREDGDSVAIREALALGLPVLASAVVNRPGEVETYVDGQLTRALSGFLDRLAPLGPGETQDLRPVDDADYSAFVLEVLGEPRAR